jgi:hypothetical protein
MNHRALGRTGPRVSEICCDRLRFIPPEQRFSRP